MSGFHELASTCEDSNHDTIGKAVCNEDLKQSPDTLKNGIHKFKPEGLVNISDSCSLAEINDRVTYTDLAHAKLKGNVKNTDQVQDSSPHSNTSESDEAITTESSLLSSRDSCDKQDVCDEMSDLTLGLDQRPYKDVTDGRIGYVVYESELQMPAIMNLITKDLSEPYSIYTYRYFIHNWPHLCFLAKDGARYVGAIVCKLDVHKKVVRRGYIAMLAVDQEYRKLQIGTNLVLRAIQAMITNYCDEVVLETEITNDAALRLYEKLGFVRDKRLFRYYLNGVDALRLKLWLR